MGRPVKHHEGYTLKPVIVPNEDAFIWDKTKELADREHISVSELVNKALAQYVGEHYPGNPQVPLEAVGSVEIMQEYIAKRACARLRNLVGKKWDNEHAHTIAVDRALELAQKVKKPSEELLELMRKAVAGL